MRRSNVVPKPLFLCILLGISSFAASVMATGELPTLVLRISRANSAIPLMQYATRDVEVDVADPAIETVDVKRVVYQNGKQISVDRASSMRVARPANAAPGSAVSAGKVSFRAPTVLPDGFYAERIEVRGVGRGGVDAVTQDVVFYQVAGGKLIPLTIREYSAARATPVQVFDRNGAAATARSATSIPSAAAGAVHAAERIE